MPCPFHDDDSTEGTTESTDEETDAAPGGGDPFDGEDRGVDRREFMKSALVIGGTGSLSTVTDLFGMPDAAPEDDERVGIGERLNRQHGWDDFEFYHPEHEQTLPPAHHLLLHVDYAADGTPSDRHRREAAEAFRQVERAFDWSHEGVMFTVGYSLSYFRRYDDPLPAGIDPDVEPTTKPALLDAETLIETEGVTLDSEDPAADDYDACIHLASDHVQNLLAVEEALWGNEKRVNGETFSKTLEGIFTKPESYPERRVGFAGHDAVTDHLAEDTDFDETRIPGADDDGPEADLSMGFNDQYRNSLPRETLVTMLEDQRLVSAKPPGVFAQGTIQHVSKLDIHLDEWYDDHDLAGRRERMFSPEHDADNTGRVGENLGNSNAPGDLPVRNLDDPDDDLAERTEADMADHDVAGHVQKTARARFDMETRITEEGQARLSGGEELLPADERDDDLPGHDDDQRSEQVILRRDIDTTDQNTPGNHFVALMRFNPYMAYMRQAMNGVAFDSAAFGLTGENRIQHDEIGAGENSGIVNYLETQRRGNYLVPPITLRALPHPRGEETLLWADRDDDEYVVEALDVSKGDVDEDTLRFGWFYDVNRGRGARPTRVRNNDGALSCRFPADETGLDAAPGGPEDRVRVRLFCKRKGSRRPVRGTGYLPLDVVN